MQIAMQIATQIAYKFKQTIGQTEKKRMCVCEPMREHNKTVNWTNGKQNKLRCLIKWNIYCIFRNIIIFLLLAVILAPFQSPMISLYFYFYFHFLFTVVLKNSIQSIHEYKEIEMFCFCLQFN